MFNLGEKGVPKDPVQFEKYKKRTVLCLDLKAKSMGAQLSDSSIIGRPVPKMK
jgi:hypothetical protein